jgi:hypothetical protein
VLVVIFIALDAATWVNVALATVTALLTLATALLAKRAKVQARAAENQAKATAELVEIARRDLAIAERDLAATATPHLVPIAPLGEGTGGRFAGGGVVANLRNLGGANAEYQSSTLTLIYGGEVMRGEPLGNGPIIKPDEQFSIQFVNSEELPSSGHGLLEVLYQGPGSGTQRVARFSVFWDGESVSVRKRSTTT